MEKIDFIWYMKKVSLLAFLGFAAGIATYYVQEQFMQETLSDKLIEISDTPTRVQEKITADFSDYQIKEVEEYIKGEKEVIGFVVEASKEGEIYNIRFNDKGKFLEIVEDEMSPNEHKKSEEK